jgi:hypothetical protein
MAFMKKVFYFLFIILVVLGLFILGNMLRCVMARGGACPPWCQTKPVQCLSSECQTKLACQAPALAVYPDLINDWFKAKMNK